MVSKVGGVTAANVASGANAANGATSANTGSAIVSRDATGSFSASTITGSFVGNGAGLTNLNVATNTVAGFSGALAGDVTGTQAVTVVAKVGGVPVANVASAVNEIATATSAPAPFTVVVRDVNASFGAGSITGSFTGNGSGLTGLNASNLTGFVPAGGLSGTYSNPLSLTNTTNFIVGTFVGDGSGLTNLPGGTGGSSGTATNFSGMLSGDVVGTQFATIVNNVGGVNADDITSGVEDALNATSENAFNNIVRRDGGGSFSAGTITATFVGDGSGLTGVNAATFNGPLASSSFSGSYSNAVQLLNPLNTYAGTFTGTVSQNGVSLGSGSVAPLTSTPDASSDAIATVMTGPGSSGVAVSGRYAFVVNQHVDTLQIFDVSVPASPQLIGTTETPGDPVAVAVAGDYAYVLTTSFNLQVYRVNNPAQPASVGSIPIGGAGLAKTLSLSGHYAYVGGGNGEGAGLFVVDLTNPLAPQLAGFAGFGSGNGYVAQAGQSAYGVSDQGNGLNIFDVTHPMSPLAQGSAPTGNSPNGIAVSGRYAYVVNSGDTNLEIFDVSNQNAPAAVSTNAMTGHGRTVVVSDHYAYVVGDDLADGNGFFQIFDVSNPLAPVSLGSRTVVSQPDAIVVDGRYAFLVSSNANELEIFDLGGAYLQQVEAGSIEAASLQTRDDVRVGNNLDVRGGLAAATGRFSGDLGVTGNLEVSGSISGNINVNSLQGVDSSPVQFISPGNIFAGDGSGLTNLNVAGTIGSIEPSGVTVGPGSVMAPLTVNPDATSTAISTITTGAPPSSLAVYGRYAYVGNGADNTLQIFDVSVPNAPKQVGNQELPVSPTVMAVDGNFAYVVDSTLHMLTLDVTDPAQPQSFGVVQLNPSGFAASLTLGGHYAYVGGNDGEADILYTVDISNPGFPALVGSSSFGFGQSIITQAGRYAYGVDENDNTLGAFDVSNPTNPNLRGTAPIGHAPVAIAVSGRFAYVADSGDTNLQIVDISNPGSPVSISTNATFGTPSSVVVAGHYVYVAGSDNGDPNGFLQIFDVSNPASPMSLGSRVTIGFPSALVVSGRYAFLISSNNNEFQIFDLGGAYLQQVEAGTIEAGTLQTRDNVMVGNNLMVRGGLSAMDGRFEGDLGVQGSIEVSGTISADLINGSVNAANVFGTLSPAALTGAYDSPVQFTSTNNIFEGDGSGLTGLNPANLTGPIANTQLANSTITINAGNGLAGGGSVALGNSISLNTSATSANTPTAIVSRDASGSFAADNITASELILPPTTATSGIIFSGANTLLHTFGATNFFSGVNAGNLTVTGANNTGAGNSALHGLANGINNTGMGSVALVANTTGNNNSALGTFAGGGNTTGSNNIFLGAGAGDSANPTASSQFSAGSAVAPITNVYFGNGLSNAVPANFNINGSGGLGANINGGNVTLAGGLSTGLGNGGAVIFTTSPPNGSGLPGPTPNPAVERMRILANGDVGIGTTNPTFTLQVNGSVAGVGAYNNVSDERYKQNITPLTNALAKIMEIDGVQYDWRTNEFPQIRFDSGTQIGFIAQQLKNVLPEAVTQDNAGYYSIAYSKVIPVLVEAMKDQQKEIASKDAELQQMRQHESEVEARLTALENALKTVADNKR